MRLIRSSLNVKKAQSRPNYSRNTEYMLYTGCMSLTREPFDFVASEVYFIVPVGCSSPSFLIWEFELTS